MRFFRVLLCDMHYQFKYGFYLLYVLISLLYSGMLLISPVQIQREAAAVIIMSDPAALGFFFIGGLVLLEKGEGLHSYLAIIPVTTGEYILAKVFSLSFISTLAGLAIATVGLRGQVNYVLMAAALLTGSAIFTLFGLAVGSMARSVNHYLVLGIPVGVALMGPSLLTAFGMTNPLIEALPSTLLLRLLCVTAGLEIPYSIAVVMTGLVLWLLPAFWYAKKRFMLYLQQTGS